MKLRTTTTAVLAGILLSSCTSEFIPLTPRLGADSAKLGHATGRACGMVIPYAGAEQFLPIGVASRGERAYDRALASVPGAVALRDVEIRDDWLWPVVGLHICTTISGDAVR